MNTEPRTRAPTSHHAWASRALALALLAASSCAPAVDDEPVARAAEQPLTVATGTTATTSGGGAVVTPPACNRVTACTYEHLVGGACVRDAWPDGSSCSDGNPCNGAETCLRGVCQPGSPPTCDDRNPCTDDRCDPARGCVASPNTGNACSDANACTVVDRCEAGVCRGAGSTRGTPVAPTVGEVTVTAPLPSRVLTREPIWYVAGDTVDVGIVLPACAWVTGVSVGGRALDTRPHTACSDAGAAYDCEPRYYTVLRDEELTPVSQSLVGGFGWPHRIWVRVRLLNPANGSAEALRVTVASAVGTAYVDRALAYVREATTNDTHYPDGSVPIARVTLGEAAIRNEFFAGMYARFGSVGEVTDSAGQRVAYEPDFAGSSLALDDAGVSFQQRFRVDLHVGNCNPRASVTGRFHLAPSAGRVEVVWDESPAVSLDYPSLCVPGVWIVGGPLYQIVLAMAGDGVAGEIREALQSRIDESLGPASLAVRRVETHSGRIDAWLIPLFDRVSFDVRYDNPGIAMPAQWGLPINANERVILFVGGTTRVCERDSGVTSTCAAQTLGPEGAFNWADLSGDAGAPPVPDPWESASGWPAYYVTRDQARRRLIGLWRDPFALPRHDRSIAALLARHSGTADEHAAASVGSPCTIRPSVSGRLGFGPNDIRPAGNTLGTGAWDVTVMLLGTSSLSGVPTCW